MIVVNTIPVFIAARQFQKRLNLLSKINNNRSTRARNSFSGFQATAASNLNFPIMVLVYIGLIFWHISIVESKIILGYRKYKKEYTPIEGLSFSYIYTYLLLLAIG
jgi:hypothetical protein